MLKQRVLLSMLAAGVFGNGVARAEVIWSQNFDTSGGSLATAGFNLNPASAQNLWHITSNNPAGGSGYALGFVQGETPNQATADGNYNVGNVAADGWVVSNAISLSNPSGFDYSNERLSFDVYLGNEIPHTGWSTEYDRLTVRLSLDGGASWFANPLASSYTTLTANDVDIAYNAINDYSYATYTVDLVGAFALEGLTLDQQSIYLGFRFYTLDHFDNDYPGARVDNLVISADKTAIAGTGGGAGGGTTPVPEPATLALLGLGLFGLGMARRR